MISGPLQKWSNGFSELLRESYRVGRKDDDHPDRMNCGISVLEYKFPSLASTLMFLESAVVASAFAFRSFGAFRALTGDRGTMALARVGIGVTTSSTSSSLSTILTICIKNNK